MRRWRGRGIGPSVAASPVSGRAAPANTYDPGRGMSTVCSSRRSRPQHCRAVVVLLLALAGLIGAPHAAVAAPTAPGATTARGCGITTAGGARYRVVRQAGRLSCARARGVVRYVVSHGTPTQGRPGRAPRGWACAWTYYEPPQRGRAGPICRRRGARVAGYAIRSSQASARTCGVVRGARLHVAGRVSCGVARRIARRYGRKAARGRGCPPSGNTCPLRIRSFRCATPTSGYRSLVLSCSSSRLGARIRGYEAA